MAKLAASEAATFCSHQVRQQQQKTEDTEESLQTGFSPTCFYFTSGDTGPGWDGLRVRHAS